MGDVMSVSQYRWTDKTINEIKDSKALTEKNKQIMLNYYNEKIISSAIKKTSITYKLMILRRLAEFTGKDFKEITKEDIVRFFNELKPLPKTPWLNGKKMSIKINGYSPHSLWLYKQHVKSFWRAFLHREV